MIRTVRSDDAKAICSIYNHYVRETVITFEEIPVSMKEMGARIDAVRAKFPWFVLEEGAGVEGYAHLNTWRERSAYRFTVEPSIYLKPGTEGRGRGSALMTALLEAAKKAGLHALVSAVTLPNERSAALHEKFGFTRTAVFTEIGFKQGRWLDVGYWELVLRQG